MSPTSTVRAAHAFAALAVKQAYERFGQNMEADVSLEVLRVITALCAAAESAPPLPDDVPPPGPLQ